MNPQDQTGNNGSEPQQDQWSAQPAPASVPAQEPVQEPVSQSPINVGQVAVNGAPQNSAADPGEFTSNPFATLGKGLGSTFSTNPLSAIYIALIPILIVLPFYFLAFVILFSPIIGALVGLVAVIVAILFILRAYVGMLIIASESRKKNTVTTKQAFNELSNKYIVPVFFTSILAAILIFVGFMLFIIPGIIILARISLFPFVIINEDKKYLQAIKRSFALTKGHTIEMLGLLATTSIAGSNGILALVASSVATEQRYSELVKFDQAGKSTGKVHKSNYLIFLVVMVIFVVVIVANIFSALSLNNNDDSPFEEDGFFQFEDSTNGSSDFEFDYDYDFETN